MDIGIITKNAKEEKRIQAFLRDFDSDVLEKLFLAKKQAELTQLQEDRQKLQAQLDLLNKRINRGQEAVKGLGQETLTEWEDLSLTVLNTLVKNHNSYYPAADVANSIRSKRPHLDLNTIQTKVRDALNSMAERNIIIKNHEHKTYYPSRKNS